MRRAPLLVLLLMLSSCYGAQSGMLAGALLNSAIGLAAASNSRANGGCYASCPWGTTCNGATGMCEELPCRGRCAPDEICQGEGAFQQCLRPAPVDLRITSEQPEPPL